MVIIIKMMIPKTQIQAENNKKFLWMFHGSRGAVFSKSAPLAAGGKVLLFPVFRITFKKLFPGLFQPHPLLTLIRFYLPLRISLPCHTVSVH